MNRYPNEADQHAQECLATVRLEDAISLAKSLRGSGVPAWLAWESENREQAIEFLRATPATRQKRKQWQDPAHRARLALAAHHLARLAVEILSATYSGHRGLGSPAAIEAAAWLALRILDLDAVRQWPWPCEPPFPEWSCLCWPPPDDDDFEFPPGWPDQPPI